MGKITKAFEKSSSAAKNKPGVPAEPASPPDQSENAADARIPTRNRAAGPANSVSRQQWDLRLQIATDPNTAYFESFRRLRASILYPSSGNRPKTLLVTSAIPHEGKGFVCANLGIALSQGMENYAMMVDCDFRHPTLAGLFGLTNEAGLVDYLQEDVDLSMLIRKTGQPKLSLIPSGKPPKNPAELLESARMASLIDEVAGRYPDRLILFDSPPDLVASETSTLAKQVDGVVLVVRYGAAKKAHVKQFAETLGHDRIYGVVFNAFPENAVEAFLEKKLGYGYGYGSGYYHYSS
ncbi:MAG: CpsD/CapB family tyrosine-protein kinase [Desulfobacteraceae bacterium]|nr:CpsD/CapB family tyrosine-protein kinase [Desulfobacteraceae bacterium]MCF8094809.1 CpsD/CapB family tyrosine-protein kinase [Desulfobacteraceae bacterium]